VVENIIEAMVDAVLVIDVEGRITLANTAASRITGYSRSDLQQLPVAKLLIDDSSGIRTVVRRRIEDGDVMRRDQAWLLAKDGTRVPVSVTGSAVVDDKSSLQGIVLVARDVREVRQLLADKEAEIARRRVAEDELRTAKASIEDQLDQARSQLMTAERRATLGTLAGGVGHELRNIAQIQVAAVDELAQALKGHGDLRELAEEILPDLERVAEHITTHGQRLLQLARPGPDRVNPIDLNDVVRDVVTMLRGAGKFRRVDVKLALEAEPVIVTVNRTRIEQILVNLLVNAVDAIGDVPATARGTITMHTSLELATERALCAVTDSGCGIPADQLDKIFVPFFTTKPEDRGTGLGLSVAREIVESYGGELRVASTLGEGTTFTFLLPR